MNVGFILNYLRHVYRWVSRRISRHKFIQRGITLDLFNKIVGDVVLPLFVPIGVALLYCRSQFSHFLNGCSQSKLCRSTPFHNKLVNLCFGRVSVTTAHTIIVVPALPLVDRASTRQFSVPNRLFAAPFVRPFWGPAQTISCAPCPSPHLISTRLLAALSLVKNPHRGRPPGVCLQISFARIQQTSISLPRIL